MLQLITEIVETIQGLLPTKDSTLQAWIVKLTFLSILSISLLFTTISILSTIELGANYGIRKVPSPTDETVIDHAYRSRAVNEALGRYLSEDPTVYAVFVIFPFDRSKRMFDFQQLDRNKNIAIAYWAIREPIKSPSLFKVETVFNAGIESFRKKYPSFGKECLFSEASPDFSKALLRIFGTTFTARSFDLCPVLDRLGNPAAFLLSLHSREPQPSIEFITFSGEISRLLS